MKQMYPRMVQNIRRHREFARLVVIGYKILPWIFLFAYGITLLILLFTWNLQWIFYGVVPAVSVVVCTIIRTLLNMPRPFQVTPFSPLVKHKPGYSFPSRHTTSAVAIGMACLYLSWVYGVIMLVLALAVALTRILSGVHYIKDVLAGYVISIGIGLLGYCLISPLCGLGGLG